MSRLRHLCWAAVLAAGCAPMTPLPPFHFGETAKALDQGELSVGFSAGTGSLRDQGPASGLGMRGRLGLKYGQEFGGDLQWMEVRNGDPATPSQPWKGHSTVFSEKLTYKKTLGSRAAVSAGLGASHSATGQALGGDLALHLSTEGLLLGFRPYAGLRYGLAYPLDRGPEEAGGLTRGLNAALGLSYEMGFAHSAFLEFGSLSTWNRSYASNSLVAFRTVQDFERQGAYLAAGLTRRFGRAAAKDISGREVLRTAGR